MNNRELMLEAVAAREKSYSPYSGYRVGAALLTASGKVYLGCNIENSGYSATVCAERCAIFKAVSEGERDFVRIAVVGGDGEAISGTCTPCGVCRQVMSEFCGGGFEILLGTPDDLRVYTLAELLPLQFSDLEGRKA